VCEYYISHGLCTNFPDCSIAAAGSEANLKIGYEYARMVTAEEQEVAGEEQEVEQQINLIEEATDGNQIVPDPQEERSMVATSSAVSIYMYILCVIISFSLRSLKYL
jgi:hypothetical protein